MREASTCDQTTRSGGFVDASIRHGTGRPVAGARRLPSSVHRTHLPHLRVAGHRRVGGGRAADGDRYVGRGRDGRTGALVTGAPFFSHARWDPDALGLALARLVLAA